MAAQDLNGAIDWSAVECLNQKPDHTVQNALKQGYREDDGLYLESDTDEQLLIHVPFNSACKLSGLVVKSTKSGDQAPKRIKLFVNQPTIGFGEAADAPGVQEFELSESDLEGQQLQLKLVKFTKGKRHWLRAGHSISLALRVNVLTIFVESNQGDEDTTIIQKLAVFGSTGDSFNVAEIKDISKEDK